jgi:hypothetical protein
MKKRGGSRIQNLVVWLFLFDSQSHSFQIEVTTNTKFTVGRMV